MLISIGGVLVVILLIIVICISCSSGKSKNKRKRQPQSLRPQQEETTAIPETTTMAAMYTTDALNLEKAEYDSDIITTIGAGKRVEIISEEGSCVKYKGKNVDIAKNISVMRIQWIKINYKNIKFYL
ncbi:MAG: hypothetical protein ACLR1A_02000 [Eubacterium ventriosum]